MYSITSTCGQLILVDQEDFHALSAHAWGIKDTGRHLYARATSSLPERFMHRLILGAPKGFHVDHINGNSLDNRRSNIRLATRSNNMWNTSKHVDNSTGFKGVTLHKKTGKYHSRLSVHGKVKCSRYFDTPEEAARAYDQLAVLHHGEFARPNFS